MTLVKRDGEAWAPGLCPSPAAATAPATCICMLGTRGRRAPCLASSRARRRRGEPAVSQSQHEPAFDPSAGLRTRRRSKPVRVRSFPLTGSAEEPCDSRVSKRPLRSRAAALSRRPGVPLFGACGSESGLRLPARWASRGVPARSPAPSRFDKFVTGTTVCSIRRRRCRAALARVPWSRRPGRRARGVPAPGLGAARRTRGKG